MYGIIINSMYGIIIITFQSIDTPNTKRDRAQSENAWTKKLRFESSTSNGKEKEQNKADQSAER